jgi:hypothetical protein
MPYACLKYTWPMTCVHLPVKTMDHNIQHPLFQPQPSSKDLVNLKPYSSWRYRRHLWYSSVYTCDKEKNNEATGLGVDNDVNAWRHTFLSPDWSLSAVKPTLLRLPRKSLCLFCLKGPERLNLSVRKPISITNDQSSVFFKTKLVLRNTFFLIILKYSYFIYIF